MTLVNVGVPISKTWSVTKANADALGVIIVGKWSTLSEKSWENCNLPLILNSSAMPPNHLLIRKIDYISNSNMRSENIIGLQSYPATNVVSQGK